MASIIDPQPLLTKGPPCHENGCTGYGNTDSGVVLVGIAPGRNEVHTGRPFTGPAGQLLDAVLDSIEWPRHQVYTTNLICWYNDSPTPAEINRCAPRLHEELAWLKPRVVIPMGKIATEAILGVPDSFGLERGLPQWREMAWGSTYILPTYHTSAILRGQVDLIHDVYRDLYKIPQVMQWPQNSSYAHVAYEVARTPERAQAVLDALPRSEIVTIDIETDNREMDRIDPFEDRLICLSITWGWDNTVVFPAEVTLDLKWPLDVQWTMQNGMFDAMGLRKLREVSLPIVHDTMLQSYALDERQGFHALGLQAGEYCGAGHYKARYRGKNKKGIVGDMPLEKAYEYNAHDSAYTWRLCKRHIPELVKDNVYDMYTSLLIPAANALSEITERGVRIDPIAVRTLALDWFPKYLEGEEKLQAYAHELGWPTKDINFASPLQMSKFLFGTLGLPILKVTKKGAASTDKTVLESLRGEHPFIDKFQEHRQLDHIIGTYVLGVQDDIKADGRVHASPLIHGARTGRMSYHDPPLQTIPKDRDEADWIGQVRAIFAATDENSFLMEADYKYAELWTAAAYSQDPQLLADLASGDPHRLAAAEFLSKDPRDITKRERHSAKFVSFGIMYGRQAPSLAKGELKCTTREAQMYMDRWLGRYPTYAAQREKWKQTAIDEGELVTITGRKRRFKLIMGPEAHEMLNQAVNFPIQSTSHDMLLSSLIELHYRLRQYNSYVLFEVHDSLLLEVDKAYRQEVRALVWEVMTKPRFPGWVSVPIEVSEGPDWGHMVEIPDDEIRRAA